jgi:tRNA pseudouridine32 synthase/23S rRNA pseudouridine746 synthase
MTVLYPPSDFISCDWAIDDSFPPYWYTGRCPQSGELLRLPRTRLAEVIARGLMQHLATDEKYSREGKMYGVLLVETPAGEQLVLKAFSGLLNGNSVVEGWVPPIGGRDRRVVEEAHTLASLETIKQELIALQHILERQQYQALSDEFETRLQQLSQNHDRRKHERQHQRQLLLETLNGTALEVAIEQLNEQSRQDGIERKQFKRQRDAVLQRLKDIVEQADARIHQLKQRRKALSRQLQAQMQASYWLTNFAGESLPLQELMPSGSMPTGTGDCCAPKLLHYAATHSLKPLAMAEFWWGSPSINRDKVQGEFYQACADRCQPLMGFLLSGLPQRLTIAEIGNTYRVPILYEDEWLIAVNKPAGLLSVPGRYSDRQDSVLARLRHLLPDGMAIATVHRLDIETSGILLLTRDRQTHRHLSQQFQQRRVQKVYEAILAGSVTIQSGAIELPLWGDPSDRPYQKVDEQRGKPSVTQFRVIATEGGYTRMEFLPLTGRTHQIRVHAADARGLGIPILGDRLYGCRAKVERLHLHARELCFEHPQLGQIVSLQAETPF